MMSDSTKRSILRWIHIVFAIPIAGYVYSPFKELPNYASVVRSFAVPVLVLTGLWPNRQTPPLRNKLFAQIAPSRTALLGSWEFREGGTFKGFTGYTTFKSDGTCLQIGRGKALGLPSWIYVESSWRLDGDESLCRSHSAFTYREFGDNEDLTER
jgi:hypothetical protein